MFLKVNGALRAATPSQHFFGVAITRSVSYRHQQGMLISEMLVLSMYRFWALSPLLISATLSFPAVAQMSAPCWMDMGDGPVDLTNAMCGGYSEMPGATPGNAVGGSLAVQTSSSNPFPGWLLDGIDARSPYETGYLGDGSWIYENRYIMDFREWPNTADPGAEAEWSYVDCQTLWVGQEYLDLDGSVGEWFTSPEDAIDPVRHRQIYGAKCNQAGL